MIDRDLLLDLGRLALHRARRAAARRLRVLGTAAACRLEDGGERLSDLVLARTTRAARALSPCGCTWTAAASCAGEAGWEDCGCPCHPVRPQPAAPADLQPHELSAEERARYARQVVDALTGSAGRRGAA